MVRSISESWPQLPVSHFMPVNGEERLEVQTLPLVSAGGIEILEAPPEADVPAPKLLHPMRHGCLHARITPLHAAGQMLRVRALGFIGAPAGPGAWRCDGLDEAGERLSEARGDYCIVLASTSIVTTAAFRCELSDMHACDVPSSLPSMRMSAWALGPHLCEQYGAASHLLPGQDGEVLGCQCADSVKPHVVPLAGVRDCLDVQLRVADAAAREVQGPLHGEQS